MFEIVFNVLYDMLDVNKFFKIFRIHVYPC